MHHLWSWPTCPGQLTLKKKKKVHVCPKAWNTDLHYYVWLTFCYFPVPILFTVMILSKHLHMGMILSVVSSMYGLTHIFASLTYWNTSLTMLCLSPYIGYRHDTLQTLKYGQYRFSSIIHVRMRPMSLLHWLNSMLHWFYDITQSLYRLGRDTWHILYDGFNLFTTTICIRSIFLLYRLYDTLHWL